jgi:cytochrome c
MKKQLTLLSVALLLVAALTVLKISSINAAPQTEISYSRDVQPILESRCATCHFGEFTSADLHMDTYESLMAGSQEGPVIVPGNAKKSLLVQKISSGEMPKRGPKLTPVQIQIIIDWINAGAENN